MAYVTLADIRQHGGYDSDDTVQNAEISALIPRAQAAIEAYTHNIFEIGAVSTRTFDYGTDTDGYCLLFDEWLATITSLTVTNGDGDTVASSKYVTLPRNRTPIYGLELKLDSTVVWTYSSAPQAAISLEGYWGYSTSPPENVQLACIQLVLHWLRMEDQAEDKVLPDDVCLLLAPYKKVMAW